MTPATAVASAAAASVTVGVLAPSTRHGQPWYRNSTAVDSKPDGVQVARSAGQQDRTRTGGRRGERTAPVEPRADGFSGHPFLYDIAAADGPPRTDLPHGWQQHVVDAGGEAQRCRGLIEQGTDRGGIQPLGGSEDLVDQVLCRSLPTQ